MNDRRVRPIPKRTNAMLPQLNKALILLLWLSSPFASPILWPPGGLGLTEERSSLLFCPPLSLPLLRQYGLLHPGGSWLRSAVFGGGTSGLSPPQRLCAAATAALLLEDGPAEPRVALEGSPVPVSRDLISWFFLILSRL